MMSDDTSTKIENTEFYSLTVKSNLFAPLYFDAEGRLSFDDKEKSAFEAAVKDTLLAPEKVLAFIKSISKHDDGLKSSRIEELEIECIFEKADLNLYPIKVELHGKYHFYAQPATIRRLIIEKKRKIEKIENQIEEIQGEIESLEIQKDDLEYISLADAKKELDELEAEASK